VKKALHRHKTCGSGKNRPINGLNADKTIEIARVAFGAPDTEGSYESDLGR
jgi:hypothetical protein